MNGYFPMFFDVEGKKVLIVGAGTIALRRVETLLSFGASITVAAPDWKETIGRYRDAGRLRLIERAYTPDLVQSEYFILIAATSDVELNHEICEEGRKQGILVNNASDKSQCDFYFPAIVSQGDVVAGVCAGGKNHRLVRQAAAGMRSWLKQFMSSYEDNTKQKGEGKF